MLKLLGNILGGATMLALVVGVGWILWLAAEGHQDGRRRIQEDGYNAARAGAPPEACPHADRWNGSWERELWLRGWLAGNRELRRKGGR